MLLGLWIDVGWMVLVALSAVVLLIWGWRRNQFHDVEEAKYRMLEDKEPESWPNRRKE